MTPQDPHVERRRETRYPLEAKVLIRKKSGETLRASAVNISSSGMRVCIEQEPCPLQLDDEVTVEVELPDSPGKPFSAWGLGRVAYLDRAVAGIQLFGGEFDAHPEPDGED